MPDMLLIIPLESEVFYFYFNRPKLMRCFISSLLQTIIPYLNTGLGRKEHSNLACRLVSFMSPLYRDLDLFY